jgi:hypothetical protein
MKQHKWNSMYEYSVSAYRFFKAKQHVTAEYKLPGKHIQSGLKQQIGLVYTAHMIVRPELRHTANPVNERRHHGKKERN